MSQYKIKNITEAEEKLVDILVGKANDIAERTKAADVCPSQPSEPSSATATASTRNSAHPTPWSRSWPTTSAPARSGDVYKRQGGGDAVKILYEGVDIYPDISVQIGRAHV